MRRETGFLIAMVTAVAVSVAGCQGKPVQNENPQSAEMTSVETTGVPASAEAEAGTAAIAEETKADFAKADTADAADSAKAGQTRIFTDSAGREVEIPAEITKIAPSGPLAQIVLYTVSPDKLAGRSSDFSEEAKRYIDEKYWGLPKFGQFYGKNASLNMEALILEAPDVIIDIGEAKKTVKEDMDALQEQLGIPVLFVEATLPAMEGAYEMLGEITGETEQAAKLAAYCKEVLVQADESAAAIPEADRRSVYFASGDNGLHTNARGTIHADIIDKIGGVNVADVEMVSSGSGSEVSFEQVLLWQPDVIIADTQALYDILITDPIWQELDAVKKGNVYKIPTAPYSFMSSPPSVNRLIGIQWLGQLVYPEQYTKDIKEEVKSFYKLFYHIDVTQEQLAEILKDSIPGFYR